ncbi:hypothetical protein HX049_05160 [Myroides odoratimimus]|uniref:hypothetical protein n=1 Tax=Myroides odoratimimus TaxID=76832 RepID=UPI002578D758|nr:hypothetical protein [Myroides odoratimimus]MDM1396558.1 hypothetical protein [Myroides odoratimimus]
MNITITILKNELENASTNLLNDVYILYKVRRLHLMAISAKLWNKKEIDIINHNLKELLNLKDPYNSKKKLIDTYTWELIIKHYNTLCGFVENKNL